MLIYSALPSGHTEYFLKYLLGTKFKCNNLISFYFDVSKYILQIEELSNNLIVDSGAFSLFNVKNQNIDFDNFFKKYREYVKKYEDSFDNLWFIELDIASIVGYDKVMQYRKQLFEVTDKILPVWHSYMGLEEYKKLVNDYDYICIGSTVWNNNEFKPAHLSKLIAYSHKHKTKVHLLGVTNTKILRKVPIDSVDSSSWFRVRYGSYVDVNMKNGQFVAKRLNSDYLKNYHQKAMLISYINQLKFQDYWQNYWKNYNY